MRVLPLLLVLVALAGCTQPTAVQPAAVTDPNAAPTPAEAAPATNATSSSPAASGATSPSNDTAGTTGAPTTPSPQAPPMLPWNLTASAQLGYLVGAQDPSGAAPAQPAKTSADHCNAAKLKLPEGATTLAIVWSGAWAGPSGAGGLALSVKSPAGQTMTLAPQPPASPDAASAPVVLKLDAKPPLVGTWTFTADPSPASAGQTWSLQVTATGAATEPPAKLTLTPDPACAG